MTKENENELADLNAAKNGNEELKKMEILNAFVCECNKNLMKKMQEKELAEFENLSRENVKKLKIGLCDFNVIGELKKIYTFDQMYQSGLFTKPKNTYKSKFNEKIIYPFYVEDKLMSFCSDDTTKRIRNIECEKICEFIRNSNAAKIFLLKSERDCAYFYQNITLENQDYISIPLAHELIKNPSFIEICRAGNIEFYFSETDKLSFTKLKGSGVKVIKFEDEETEESEEVENKSESEDESGGDESSEEVEIEIKNKNTKNDFEVIKNLTLDKLYLIVAKAKDIDAYLKEETSINKKLKLLRGLKNLKHAEYIEIANSIIFDLLKKGRFLIEKSTQKFFYYDNENSKIFNIDSLEFEIFLNIKYQVNRADKEFKFLQNQLKSKIYAIGEKISIKKHNFFDAVNNELYIANCDEIIKLDGNKICIVKNGHNNIYFDTENLTQKWNLIENPNEIKESLDELLFNYLNLSSSEDSALTTQDQKQLLQYYFFSIYFSSMIKNKVILLIIAAHGAGKSFVLELISYIIAGTSKLTSVAKEGDFLTLISQNLLLYLDNLDNLVNLSWLIDKIAIYSTGGVVEKRKLYTDADIAYYVVNCWIGSTSRTNVLKRVDLLQRTLLLRTAQIENNFLTKDYVFKEIDKNKDKIMTLIVNTLNKLVANIKKNPRLEATDFRMSDWAAILFAMSENEDEKKQIENLLKKLTIQQGSFMRENDELLDLIADYLEKNDELVGTTQQVFHELKEHAADKNYDTNFIKNVQSFGLMLKHRSSELSKEFDVKITNSSNIKRYEIKKKILEEKKTELIDSYHNQDDKCEQNICDGKEIYEEEVDMAEIEKEQEEMFKNYCADMNKNEIFENETILDEIKIVESKAKEKSEYAEKLIEENDEKTQENNELISDDNLELFHESLKKDYDVIISSSGIKSAEELETHNKKLYEFYKNFCVENKVKIISFNDFLTKVNRRIIDARL